MSGSQEGDISFTLNDSRRDGGDSRTAVVIVDGQTPDNLRVDKSSQLMGSTMGSTTGSSQDPADDGAASDTDGATSGTPQSGDVEAAVGFEKHQDDQKYNYNAQKKDWDVNWQYQLGKQGTISDEKSKSGDLSLKIDYPDDSQTNTGASWAIEEQNEYYLSYEVKFESEFDFDGSKFSGGKLPGLGTGELASGGEKPTGTNGFTSRPMWRENGRGTLYLYHMDMPGKYGETFNFEGEDGGDRFFEPGKWHKIQQRIEVNDGNQANGEVDMWLDGERVIDLDGLQFVSDGSGIDTTYFSTFFGGNGSGWWPDTDVSAYFDNFVVSDSPI